MNDAVISPKKLIEVALPLDAINAASAREKSIRHGHPSTLHLWWARRPLAAARAVIFAQLVHDPEDLWRCQNPGVEPNAQHKGHWTRERARLFKIIEDLVKWENTTNEAVLEPARAEIRKAWRESCELNKHHPRASELFDPERMPGLHDPFAGGGTIPLEAQRLGLEAHASDLNPVAVLINKAMIEIPPKFAGRSAVHPDAYDPNADWKGASGLAEDVRRYGKWMRDEAFKRIGHLYPPVEVTAEMAKDRPDLEPYIGQKLTVIAWLWARTVKSPNPAFSHVDVPLASTFILSSKEGKEAYVQPVIHRPPPPAAGRPGPGPNEPKSPVAGLSEAGPDDHDHAKASPTTPGLTEAAYTPAYSFTVRVGKPPAEAKDGTSFGKQKGFRCLLSNTPINYDFVREEAIAGRMGQKLMAIVAEGSRGRVYINPDKEHELIATSIRPNWRPDLKIPDQALGFRIQLYGMRTFGDLFTSRQLVALTTFSDLVSEAPKRIQNDTHNRQLSGVDFGLNSGGALTKSYSEAISVYLACCSSMVADDLSVIVTWRNSHGTGATRSTFARQALPMTWDFAEANPFASAAGDISTSSQGVSKFIEFISLKPPGKSTQFDAAKPVSSPVKTFISTDPPYYDNIGYADLSDFFYVWLRRSLRAVYPDLFATISVPKTEELIASPFRQTNRQKAEKFFLEGMTLAMHNLANQAHASAPITIYYAFKQSDTEIADGTSSSGWETFLGAVLRSGLAITGTWPMRTERGARSVSLGTNSLASSIILVCRPRAKDAGTISRRQFVRQLNEALPLALDAMTRASEGLHSPVAPVDLSQAIIGPGMAIFSRYDAVLEADGTPMTVRTALQLINRFLAEDDFDADTQFCLHWFEQHGWEPGRFGEADTLARAKGTSVDGVKAAGVIASGGGNVRLLRWKEYPANWDPRKDSRLAVWEALHHLIRAHNTEGDAEAGRVLAGIGAKAEAARQLAYRLYTLCERANRAEDARAYNEVVTGWSGIESAAVKLPGPTQGMLFDTEADE